MATTLFTERLGVDHLIRLEPTPRRLAVVSLLLFAIPIAASLYHDIHRDYLTTPDGDLWSMYNVLRINAGMAQKYLDHPGHVSFVLIAWWLKFMHLLGVIPVSALDQLPPNRSQEFAAAYSQIIFAGRYFVTLASGVFAIAFFRTALAFTRNFAAAAAAGLLFASSPALVTQALMIYHEQLSALFALLAFAALLAASRRHGFSVAAPMVLAGLFTILSLLEKIQSVFIILALPVLVFLVIRQAAAANPSRQQPPIALEPLCLLLLISATATVLAGHMMVTSIIAWKNSGLWQILVAGYVTGAMLVYGSVYGIPRRAVMLGAGALLLGLSIGVFSSLLYDKRAVIGVVANTIEHLFNFKNVRAAGQTFSWSIISLDLFESLRAKALPAFFGLDFLRRPVALLNYLAAMACLWNVGRGNHRVAVAAGTCLALAFALAWAFTLRFNITHYDVYIHIWVYLAVAILVAEMMRMKRHAATATVAALAMLAVIAALQINRLSSPDMVLVMPPGTACDSTPRTPEIAEAFYFDCIPPR